MHNSKSAATTPAVASPGMRVRRSVGSGFTVLLVVIGLAACSSAPDRPDHEVARKNQATEFTLFGNAYFAQADYSMALRFFNLALEENIAVDNLPGIAKSYNSIGRVYAATENYAEASENYSMAIEFAELADDDEQRIQTYINRGELALRLGDDEGAIDEFERAGEIDAANEDVKNAILYHNLGTLYARQGRLEEAVVELERARAVNEELDNWIELASNYYMLASIESRRQNYTEALSYAALALDYDKRAENSVGIAADLFALGRISTHLQDEESAYQYYLRSLRVYLTLNLIEPTLELLDALQESAAETGRAEEMEEFAAQETRIREAIEPTSSSNGGGR